MQIAVPDELLKGIELTPDQALLDLVIGLFADHRATLGQAAKIAALSQPQFLEELGRRQIPIHYDVDDLLDDLKVVERL